MTTPPPSPRIHPAALLVNSTTSHAAAMQMPQQAAGVVRRMTDSTELSSVTAGSSDLGFDTDPSSQTSSAIWDVTVHPNQAVSKMGIGYTTGKGMLTKPMPMFMKNSEKAEYTNTVPQGNKQEHPLPMAKGGALELLTCYWCCHSFIRTHGETVPHGTPLQPGHLRCPSCLTMDSEETFYLQAPEMPAYSLGLRSPPPAPSMTNYTMSPPPRTGFSMSPPPKMSSHLTAFKSGGAQSGYSPYAVVAANGFRSPPPVTNYSSSPPSVTRPTPTMSRVKTGDALTCPNCSHIFSRKGSKRSYLLGKDGERKVWCPKCKMEAENSAYYPKVTAMSPPSKISAQAPTSWNQYPPIQPANVPQYLASPPPPFQLPQITNAAHWPNREQVAYLTMAPSSLSPPQHSHHETTASGVMACPNCKHTFLEQAACKSYLLGRDGERKMFCPMCDMESDKALYREDPSPPILRLQKRKEVKVAQKLKDVQGVDWNFPGKDVVVNGSMEPAWMALGLQEKVKREREVAAFKRGELEKALSREYQISAQWGLQWKVHTGAMTTVRSGDAMENKESSYGLVKAGVVEKKSLEVEKTSAELLTEKMMQKLKEMTLARDDAKTAGVTLSPEAAQEHVVVDNTLSMDMSQDSAVTGSEEDTLVSGGRRKGV